MKITKKNGRVAVYDDEKVINSILKANAGTGESLSRRKAANLADEVFQRVTEKSELISTQDVRDCMGKLLKEKGLTRTAENYLAYKK